MIARTSKTVYRQYPAYISRVLLLLCLLFVQTATAFIDVPKLERPVTDLAGVLSQDQIQVLENKMLNFQKDKGSIITILILPTTQPEDIFDYSMKLADLNMIGRHKIDDGLMMIFAINDRKMRIMPSRGLSGAIPDAIAKRIIAETIAPHFQQNDYFGGLNAALDQSMKLIEGEKLPEPQRQDVSYQGDAEGLFLFIAFAGLFIGSVLTSVFGQALGAMMAGAGSTLIASLLMGFGIGAIIVGLIVFFLLIARIGGGGGGWTSGGGGGGYYGGGGSWGGGGSAWSGGGGGSYDGGGASGSW